MTATRGKQVGLLALCAALAVLFTGLGTWQVQRLGWKRDLIQRVDARIHAAPVAPPARRDWASLDSQDVEYRRVSVRGVFRHDLETRVDALTELGPGAWVLTPLQTAEGIVLVNRGFVPPKHAVPAVSDETEQAGEVTVTGLLRLSEPGGRILRDNDPAADRWFSRDVAAIAAARGLTGVAPFFIDAEASPPAQRFPIGGLTVVRFRNAHLQYAITWFALAALCVGGFVFIARPPPRADMRGPGLSRT